MNRTADKNEGNRTRRGGIDMSKTARIELENLDRFMGAMARVLGIPRKRLDKFMFQGQTTPSFQKRSTGRRSSSRPSNLPVK
jgi:hypothetical protein